jgi:hypothetical protein
MQKRNVLHSPRLIELKRKKRKIILIKIGIFLLVFLAVIAFLAYMSRIRRLNIGNVEITGNSLVETLAIENTIKEETSGKYLWLFPKTNIFFYPKNKIKKDLGSQFRRLKDITLTIKNRTTLLVSVNERTGKYIWCGDAPTFGASEPVEQCYFLDEDGYIFDRAPYFSGEVYFKFYGKAEPGDYFLQNNFKDLILFRGRLAGMGLKPVMLYADGNGSNINVKIFLSKGKLLPTGPEIIFKSDSNLDNIAENLKTALETEPLLSEFKNKYSSLEYIDLRYENKVYYRFK